MPKELRKRGKKFKKQNAEQETSQNDPIVVESEVPEQRLEQDEPILVKDLPFGELSNDLKAYFRSIDVMLNESENSDADEKQKLFEAALSELNGNEKQAATDPECSVILERMIWDMDDFVRRVFWDSLCGEIAALSTHRFSSHVLQTLLATSTATIIRESKSIFPTLPSDASGDLRTLSTMLVDVTQELLPSVSNLIADRYGSHVLTSLLSLLSGIKPTTEQSSNRSKNWKAKHGLSKKGKEPEETYVPPTELKDAANSIVHAVLESLSANEIRSMVSNPSSTPALQLLLKVEHLCEERGLYSVLSLTPSSPSDMDLERRRDYLATLSRDTLGSLLLESLFASSPSQEEFNFLWQTLFSRSSTTSKSEHHHPSRSQPEQSSGWSQRASSSQLYRCLNHPIANHILFSALSHPSYITSFHVNEVIGECENAWRKVVLEDGRWGVLSALVGAVATIRDRDQTRSNDKVTTNEDDDLQATLLGAFYQTYGLYSTELKDEDTRKRWFVECVLSMQTAEQLAAFQRPKSGDNAETEGGEEATEDSTPWSAMNNKKRKKMDRDASEGGLPQHQPRQQQGSSLYTIPGMTLLQALLKAGGKLGGHVLESLIAIDQPSLLRILTDEKGSRIFDVIYAPTSPTSSSSPAATTSTPLPKPLIRTLTIHHVLPVFPTLIANKYGSFVGEKVWWWGDGYVREKIRQTLLKDRDSGNWEGGVRSKFGKIFVSVCAVDLKGGGRGGAWGNWGRQGGANGGGGSSSWAAGRVVQSSAPVPSEVDSSASPTKKRKWADDGKAQDKPRKDEIDNLFVDVGKFKKAKLDQPESIATHTSKEEEGSPKKEKKERKKDKEKKDKKGKKSKKGDGEEAVDKNLKSVLDAIHSAT